jgi:tetratricopeptide (TPR) repeat protein
MAWEPTIEMIRVYLSVMTEEQFNRLEDAILKGKGPTSFTAQEVKDLEIKFNQRKEKDQILFKTSERNNQGIAAEAGNNFNLAIKLYEENITEGYPALHSYERLMALYRMQKNYKEEIRVIDRAIDVFMKENERRFEIAISTPKNKEYISDIQIALETCSSVKNKEGLYIFNPYPVIKFIIRKEKAIKLQNKQLQKK